MNISTYEARIAALEAQLGPGPGPVQETGLVSVVVTPDITLSDGTSLNAKLAESMPMTESPDGWVQFSAASLTVGAQYRVRVTPGENWYAYPIGDRGPTTAPGQAGEAAESEVVVRSDDHENVMRMIVAAGPTAEPDINTMVNLRASINSPKQ